ncbi:keratin type II cytoskeletal 60 kDa component III-like [Drosophila madeirensis]|uniref:Keratin type II cytoskeletal 60 kDa component III-like n=1 Tax=Drosophila madeirensis TaxID=30013 RepID=A0AAU9GCW0_DROMD
MMRPLVLILTIALMTGSAFGSLAFWQSLLGGGAAGAAAAASSKSISNSYTLNTPGIGGGLGGGLSYGLGAPQKQFQLGVGYT